MSTAMSTVITLIQAAAQYISLAAVAKLSLLAFLAVALLVLFQPLLRGLARALLLAIKPKQSKEQRLHRRLMADAMMLKRMLNSAESSPSDVADLRALAARA